MSELTEVAAEPIKIQCNGQAYTISPLTIGDSAEVERWAEQQFWQDIKQRLAESEDKDVQKLLRHRIATISKAEVRQEAQAYIEGAESNVKFLHLMFRHKHKEITEAECADLLTTMEFNSVYADVHNLKRLDKIAELEQEFFVKVLPEVLKSYDGPDMSDFCDFFETHVKLGWWKRYQKELEPVRPLGEA